MHVRFSTCRGLPVVDDETGDAAGFLHQIVLHPDTAKVEGFLVRPPGLLNGGELFLSSMDILRWGTRVNVRDLHALSPLEDLVRLRQILEEERPVLGQPILTESGAELGKCQDVQFDTFHFVAEWLFPRKWGRWGLPIAITQIIEVRKDAIVVRDATATATEAKPTEGVPLLDPMPEAA